MTTVAASHSHGPSAKYGKSKHVKPESRSQKRERLKQDAAQLQAAVDAFDPLAAGITTFADLPLSHPTAAGVEASHFHTLTDIQARAIPAALRGHDILGAARTGSGKTLAFLVPVLEKLYRQRWSELDGLGALVISPTRELAVQIFEVLRKVGRKHAFSAGLVIGGKSLKEEAERLGRMNILVCTPGRMLQHLDQTAGFDVDNLQILVLDEADRIMDMGFQSAVDALVEHLPKSRQTLLFSATQSKRVSDLARLSLKDPEYIAVHEAAQSSTPSNLQQHYIVTPLAEKLDTLYGFIKSNVKSKMIVFLSSGKQVRFVFETFRRMQPGVPLLHLHGKQKQYARLEITRRFASAQHSCLFATDVVARGVDFPSVDWVVQVDCPEDADTYIHRVGRTARYESKGRAVLFMDPSEEEGFLQRLEHKKVPIQKIHVKEKKKRSIRNELQNLSFQDPEIKYLGQKAFISYVRSIHYNKDKDVFRMDQLDLSDYAASLGLPGAPQIKFQKGEDVKKIKNAPRGDMHDDSESGSDAEGELTKQKTAVRTKYDRMFERTNQDVLSSHYNKLVGDDHESGDDEDFLAVKRVLKGSELDSVSGSNGVTRGPKVLTHLGHEPVVIDSKRREKALLSKKKMLKYKGNPTKLVFDDEGGAHAIYELQNEDDFQKDGEAEEQRRRFVEGEGEKVREADMEDKQLAWEKKRVKREKRKAKERESEVLKHGTSKEAVAGGGDMDEDALALMRSLPVAGKGESGRSGDEGDERPKKKAKWFGSEARRDADYKDNEGTILDLDRNTETLADLEALAAGLLD